MSMTRLFNRLCYNAHALAYISPHLVHAMPCHSIQIEFNKSLSHMCVCVCLAERVFVLSLAGTRACSCSMCLLICEHWALAQRTDHRFHFDWMRASDRERAKNFPCGRTRLLPLNLLYKQNMKMKKKYFPNIIVWNGPTEMQTLRPLRIDYYSGTRAQHHTTKLVSQKCESMIVKWKRKRRSFKMVKHPNIKLMNEPPKNRKHAREPERRKKSGTMSERKYKLFTMWMCEQLLLLLPLPLPLLLWIVIVEMFFSFVLHWDFVCLFAGCCWRRRDAMRYPTHFVIERNAMSVVFWEKCTTFIVASFILNRNTCDVL